jgi:hypothetical protein
MRAATTPSTTSTPAIRRPPTYDWIEIDPRPSAAPRTALALADTGVVRRRTWRSSDLPFAFRYYGRDFTKISVCSNGWLSFGATPVVYYRNWKVPTPGAADDMVAVFWDELRLTPGEGGVFTWYDAANHRFVVEWSRLRNAYTRTGHHARDVSRPCSTTRPGAPAETGDGDILLQYHTVNQVDALNGYATAGIQNHERNDGVLYSYWNLAAPGAAPLQAGRAVLFTSLVNRPERPVGRAAAAGPPPRSRRTAPTRSTRALPSASRWRPQARSSSACTTWRGPAGAAAGIGQLRGGHA